MTSREPHAHAHHHEHDHSAQSHAQSHAQDHALRQAAGLSLLRMSAAQRLMGAGALVALLWLGVFWALT